MSDGRRLVRSLDIRVRNEIAELATIRDALDSLGAELRIPARTLIRLQVALDEIAGNAIRYAWPDRANGEIHVRVTVHPEDVTLDIFDDGIPFDPRDVPEPAPAAQRLNPGGIGIHMVKQLVDDFTWRRVDGRNHSTLTIGRTEGTKHLISGIAPKQE